MAIEIVDLPIIAMVIFHSYGKLRLWYLNSYGKSLRIIIQTMSSSINGNILRILFEHILNTHELMNIYEHIFIKDLEKGTYPCPCQYTSWDVNQQPKDIIRIFSGMILRDLGYVHI